MHFKIVNNFILKQINESSGVSKPKAIGTGGTALEEFLSYIINKTRTCLLLN